MCLYHHNILDVLSNITMVTIVMKNFITFHFFFCGSAIVSSSIFGEIRQRPISAGRVSNITRRGLRNITNVPASHWAVGGCHGNAAAAESGAKQRRDSCVFALFG